MNLLECLQNFFFPEVNDEIIVGKKALEGSADLNEDSMLSGRGEYQLS